MNKELIANKRSSTGITPKTLGPLLAPSFGVSWGIIALLILFYDRIVAISVILTPLFNAARGSLLIAVLYHFQMMNPIFPDAQPWDNLIFAIVAVMVVWFNRDTMFQRGAGVTDFLMPEGTGERPEQTHGMAPVH